MKDSILDQRKVQTKRAQQSARTTSRKRSMTGKPVRSPTKSKILLLFLISYFLLNPKYNDQNWKQHFTSFHWWQKYYPIVTTSFFENGHTRPNAYIEWDFGLLYLTIKLMTSRWAKRSCNLTRKPSRTRILLMRTCHHCQTTKTTTNSKNQQKKSNPGTQHRHFPTSTF